MKAPSSHVSRRALLGHAIAGMAACGIAPHRAFAALLSPTPPQTAGPFYPLAPPLDRGNDLASIKGYGALAQGRLLHVTGRVLATTDRPIANAAIELWQANAFGRYHDSRDHSDRPIDPNFKGYGQFVSDGNGAYRFRTVVPGPYAGRAPHLHFAVRGSGFERLVTQMYFADEPLNESDFILRSIRDPRQRASVIVKLERMDDNGARDTARAHFDIVLGRG